MKELHLYLFGEIAQDSIDPQAWGGPKIFGTNWLVSNMNSMPDAEAIILHINSPGGDVSEGFAMYDILTTSGKKITTVIEGRCASIATVVCLAGSVRKITKNSTFFVHNPWQDGWIGDAQHFRDVADNLEAMELMLATFYNEHTGQTVPALLDFMKNETEWKADEALALGFVTEVVEVISAKALLNIENMSKPNFMDRLKNAKKALAGIKAADFATADGKTLTIDSAGDTPAEGDSVSIDGQPAPDGEYKLADGKTVVVAAGKVTTVKPAEAPAPPAPAAKQDAAVSEAVNAVIETVQNLATSVEGLVKTVGEIQNSVKKTNEDHAAAMEEVTGTLELLGQTVQSKGFKKVANKQKFNEDGTPPAAKNAEEQKASAIERARAKVFGKAKPAKKEDEGNEE